MLNKKHSVKKFRIRHDWPKHIKKWKESKSNQTQYCQQNSLDISSFSKYKKKILNQSCDTQPFVKIPSHY